ncbi:uncharacterized protein A1O5_07312 [Cladophialophora psammophila CBS 110553]|uniref:Transcription factor domain-containing protein n=1 Tax=Cladophialophora psammophila CBS 110553 TaxID=1182543 RepID=W9WX91_9EURO|nr:uncharacterized protein A1O5_07312 [Cladophialophora psammophila CBS 110553]EXJ69276.1 hypothetical protein A1O5_07312 [Cladophialophora psammophila CBS 110553]
MSDALDTLRLCGEVVHFIFGATEEAPRGKKSVNQWSALHSDWNEWVHGYPNTLSGRDYEDQQSRRRYWFPRSSFAAAMCFYHVCQIFLFSHPPNKTPTAATTQTSGAMDPETQIQHHAKNIIDIALSNMPDGVLVTMVQPVFHSARHVHDAVRRDEAILLLRDIQSQVETLGKLRPLMTPMRG